MTKNNIKYLNTKQNLMTNQFFLFSLPCFKFLTLTTFSVHFFLGSVLKEIGNRFLLIESPLIYDYNTAITSFLAKKVDNYLKSYLFFKVKGQIRNNCVQKQGKKIKLPWGQVRRGQRLSLIFFFNEIRQ